MHNTQKQAANVVEWFNRLPKPFLHGIGILLVLAVGAVDMLTGYMSDVSILYLLPVILFAWFSSGTSVALISVICTAAWFATDIAPGYPHFHAVFPLKRPLSVLGVFLLVGYSLRYMKKFFAARLGRRHSP